MPSSRALFPAGFPRPIAPYSPGVKAGRMVFVSGMVDLDEKGRTAGRGNVRAQTRSVIESITRVLEAGGGSLRDVVFNQILLRRTRDFAAMNEVYAGYFGRNPPARYTIRADLMLPDLLIEIASIAVVRAKPRRAKAR